MKQIIELYIMKLGTGDITNAEIDKYEELIELYMVKMLKRLQG
jgi:hypothetical protein